MDPLFAPFGAASAEVLAGPLERSLAYLDPGSGSYLIQLLIAGALGAALAVRMSWDRIVGFFRRKEKRPAEPDQHEE